MAAMVLQEFNLCLPRCIRPNNNNNTGKYSQCDTRTT